MANPTTYFGWVMPNSADLVTDLPADFNVFGQGVDTSMQYLLGGTTGQILSKTSGTNMAFTWINNDQGDITAVTAGTGITGGGTSGAVTITNDMATTITTAGDLIKGTGSGTYNRLGIGSTGQVLTVASGAPSWATPSSGALTKIQTSTLSAVANSSTTFDGVFTSTYLKYIVMFDQMYSSSSQQLLWQFRVSAVTRSAGYYGAYNTVPYNGSITTTNTNNGGSCQILNLQNSTGPTGLTLNVQNVGNSTAQGKIWGVGFDQTVSGPIWEGYENNTGAVNTGFILSVASGTLTGTVSIYGVQN